MLTAQIQILISEKENEMSQCNDLRWDQSAVKLMGLDQVGQIICQVIKAGQNERRVQTAWSLASKYNWSQLKPPVWKVQ